MSNSPSDGSHVPPTASQVLSPASNRFRSSNEEQFRPQSVWLGPSVRESSNSSSDGSHVPPTASQVVSPATNRFCSSDEEQRRLQSVRFLVNHAAQLSKDDAYLFQSSLEFVLDPLIGVATGFQVDASDSPLFNEVHESQSRSSSLSRKFHLSCESRNDESCTSPLKDQFSAVRSGGTSCITSTMADRFGGSRQAFGQSTVPGSFVPQHVFMHNGSCTESCDFSQGDVALGLDRRAQLEADHFGGKGHALGQSPAPLGCGGAIESIAECMEDSRSVISVMSFDQNELDDCFEQNCGDGKHDESNKRHDVETKKNDDVGMKKCRSGPAPPRFETIVGRHECYSQGGEFMGVHQLFPFCFVMIVSNTSSSLISKELDRLFSNAIQESRHAPFGEQSLLCLLQETTERQRQTPFVSVSHLKKLVMIERNPDGQIYMVQGLDRSSHFTVLTKMFEYLTVKNYPQMDNDMLQSMIETTNPVQAVQVQKRFNFVSDDKRTVVINDNSSIITLATKFVTKMFTKGNLASSFTFTEKKRSSSSPVTSVKTQSPTVFESNDESSIYSATFSIGTTSSTTSNASQRKKIIRKKIRDRRMKRMKQKQCIVPSLSQYHPDVLPTVSLGWTTQNAHEYVNNKFTIAGNIKPFLRDGGLSVTAKDSLLQCIKVVLNELPVETCFNMENHEDPNVTKFRKNMAGKFQELLGGDSCFDSSFRIEGITIVIPLGIGNHVDKMNCGSQGMNSVVSVNVKVPITDGTVPKSTKLRNWLDAVGLKEFFPLSIILYSRKCVYQHCSKVAKSIAIAKTDDVAKILHWVLVDEVGSEYDYHSNVWCDMNYNEKFMKMAKMAKTSRFQERMVVKVESYDKTVSVFST